jgi:putative spermidine/putrescine transport system substrate-binding protein/spermidine/putrescine transport system substrate-binding protein
MKTLSFCCLVALSSLFILSCNSNNKHAEENQATQPDSTRFKGQTLNILCWEGYADPKFTKGFEDKYGVKVAGTYYGSDDELVSKLQNGGTSSYDIISPSCDVASYLVDAGLVQPIDTGKISQWKNLSPYLTGMKDLVRKNDVYGVPFCWGPDYLIYDANVMAEPPASWNILMDPKFRGKVSIQDDIVSIYMAGQMLGIDKNDKAALYNMSDDQLKQCKDLLVKMKPQIRKYWATAGELDNLFKNKEVVLALGWPLTVGDLNKEGGNLKAVVPQEGATGWIDRLMITKDSKNKDLAELYLDYITQPQNMALVAEVTYYSVAHPEALNYLPDSIKSISNQSQYFEH